MKMNPEDRMKLVGLTNNPEATKKKFSYPKDWWQREFENEEEALWWYRALLKIYGYKESGVQNGWKYGFTFLEPEEDSNNNSREE
jgi:hypothetical protein